MKRAQRFFDNADFGFETENDLMVVDNDGNVVLEIKGEVTERVLNAIAVILETRRAIEIMKVADYLSEEYKDAFNGVSNKIGDLVDICFYCDDLEDYHDLIWSTYRQFEAVEDSRYYDYAIADFREYEKHYGEPDFDYDFYSDWHKDIFGYRPHRN